MKLNMNKTMNKREHTEIWKLLDFFFCQTPIIVEKHGNETTNNKLPNHETQIIYQHHSKIMLSIVLNMVMRINLKPSIITPMNH